MSIGQIDELPALMTHASVAGSLCQIPDALVRLSGGIESADDLIADLRQTQDSRA